MERETRRTAAPPEEDVDFDDDVMVGVIYIHAFEDEEVSPRHTTARSGAPLNLRRTEDRPPHSTRLADPAPRLVYCSRRGDCEGKPYYFTKTLNRVLVVDETKIEFFDEPTDTVPEGLQGRVIDYRRTPKIPEAARKVGFITIQVPVRGYNKTNFVQQCRDVYVDPPGAAEPGYSGPTPFYYSVCGPRKLKVDRDRVHFIQLYPEGD